MITFEKRSSARRERPDLAPPIEHRWTTERYVQRLGSPRMPPPTGDGWSKVGKITKDKTWVTRWCPKAHAYVFGPSNERVQHWRRPRGET
jgi:hypothetical protein